MSTYSTAAARLEASLPVISTIQDVCRVPSISVGVLHQGNVLLKTSIGVRDHERALEATPQSVYLLASCSKMFLACAIGILVAEGSMSWDDPIRTHVPDFEPHGNPRIGREATIRHALSHTTGLGKQQVLVYGPHGSVTAPEDRFVQILNQATTSDEDDGTPRFGGSNFSYSNFPFAVIGIAVQNVAKQRYADFLQERILSPLGMHHTIVTRQKLHDSNDKAIGYAKLQDDTFAMIDMDNYTDDLHTPSLAFMGIRSCVEDMLKFAAALLAAFDTETIPGGNPLREISSIWTSQAAIANDLHYCLGFYRGSLPTNGFGAISMNVKTKQEDPEFFGTHVIGKASSDRVFIGHTGNLSGFASSFYLFPGSESAVIALTNGMDLGDAADFSAKVLTQALFELKPHVDLLPLVRKEAELSKRWLDDIFIMWLEYRDLMRKEAILTDYVGDYHGLQTTINIFLRDETSHLAVTFNSNQKSLCDLEFYSADTYSFMPLTREKWLVEGMFDWDYFLVGLLYFNRDENGKVTGLDWRYEAYEPDGHFIKTEQLDTGAESNDRIDEVIRTEAREFVTNVTSHPSSELSEVQTTDTGLSKE